jgi:hypothetical protein
MMPAADPLCFLISHANAILLAAAMILFVGSYLPVPKSVRGLLPRPAIACLCLALLVAFGAFWIFARPCGPRSSSARAGSSSARTSW